MTYVCTPSPGRLIHPVDADHHQGRPCIFLNVCVVGLLRIIETPATDSNTCTVYLDTGVVSRYEHGER